ncbi:hypothetical protein JCM10212_000555 [Sporobolomyces blumeae]
MSTAALNHLIARVTCDLEFLAQEQLVSEGDVDRIKRSLALHSLPLQGLSIESNPTRGTCRAVWDYVKSQSDDLGFRKGDVIEIVEEVNSDWWKGSLNGPLPFQRAPHSPLHSS